MTSELWFVYDGECPICQMGASLYKVRQAVGRLHTVDARTETDHPVMIEINAAGLDLDQGMVLKYEERLYQGQEALHLMAMLGDDGNWFNRVNNCLFKSKRLVRACYPIMKLSRSVALCAKGSKLIRNLDGE